MTQAKRHVDIIVSHLLRDDDKMAIRYYVENRVSYSKLKEARAKASRLRVKHSQTTG